MENKNKTLVRDSAVGNQMRIEIEKEVDEKAEAMLKRIYSTFNMNSLELLLTGLFKFFKASYKKIIVNDN